MKVEIYNRDFTVADKSKIAESYLVADMDLVIFADWLSSQVHSFYEFCRLMDFFLEEGFVFVGSYRCQLKKGV